MGAIRAPRGHTQECPADMYFLANPSTRHADHMSVVSKLHLVDPKPLQKSAVTAAGVCRSVGIDVPRAPVSHGEPPVSDGEPPVSHGELTGHLRQTDSAPLPASGFAKAGHGFNFLAVGCFLRMAIDVRGCVQLAIAHPALMARDPEASHARARLQK